MDIAALVNNYVQHVFGNTAFTSISIIFIFVLIGVKRGLPLDSFIIILTPLLVAMSAEYLPFDIEPLWLFGIGLVIGFGLIALLRR